MKVRIHRTDGSSPQHVDVTPGEYISVPNGAMLEFVSQASIEPRSREFNTDDPITAIEQDVYRLRKAGIIDSEVGEHGSSDPLTFYELRIANMNRLREFPGHSERDDPWVASDWAVALVGEAGELLNKLKKIRRGVVYPGDTMPTRQDIADELADVQTYLDLLAGYLQVDLGQATRSKFNRVSDRFGLKTRLLVADQPGMKYDDPPSKWGDGRVGV